jgi:O-antigen/teichoic acid export membrane protein
MALSGMSPGKWLRAALLNPRLRAVLHGTSSAAFAKVLTSLISLVSLPLTIHYFGPARYGVWVTIVTSSAWIAVLEFGLTDTLTNTISASHATGDRTIAAQHTTNALAITFCFACLMFLAGAIVWPHIDWIRLFNVQDALAESDVRNTAAIACSLVLLTPICTIGAKILSGYQQTHVANLISATGAVLSLGGLLWGIHAHLGMPLLFLSTTGLLTLSGIGTLLWTVLISKPWLRPRIRHIDPSLALNLLSAGAPFFFIRIAGIVVFGTDNIVVSHYLGAAQVTPYSVAMRLASYAQLLPSLLFPSLWAAYAEANARGDIGWIRKAYKRTAQWSLAAISCFLIFIAVFGRWIIRVWAGTAAVPSEMLLIAMCIWALMWGMTSTQSCLLGAVGRTRTQAITGIAAAVLNLGLSIFLVQRIGSIGAVLGTIISYLLIIGPQTREVSLYFRELSPNEPRVQTFPQ